MTTNKVLAPKNLFQVFYVSYTSTERAKQDPEDLLVDVKVFSILLEQDLKAALQALEETRHDLDVEEEAKLILRKSIDYRNAK